MNGIIPTGEILRALRKTSLIATLFIKNLTWNDPESNRGIHGDRPAISQPEPWYGNDIYSA